MTIDLTNLQLPKDTLEAIEEQSSLLKSTGLQKDSPQELSELTGNFGLIYAGEIRLGNQILPGNGFSGIRIAYPTMTYDSGEWNFVGIEDDVLQVGLRASDGHFVAGAGAVELSVDGLIIETDEGGGSIANQITFVSPSDHAIEYAFIDNELTSNISKVRISANSEGNASAGGRVQLVANNANGDPAAFTVFSGTAGILATISLNTKNFLALDETNGITVFNEGGNDIDFRIESENNPNAFSLKGDTGRVGIPFLNLGIPVEATISSGAITVTGSFYTVDTEDNDPTDNLNTINGGTEGDLLILVAENTARTVVVKDGTGNIQLNGDFSLDAGFDTLMLIFKGSAWRQLSRANNA